MVYLNSIMDILGWQMMKLKSERRMSDILTVEKIREEMNSKEVDVCVFEEIDSTNTEARRRAEEGVKTPLLLVANSQSGGRGRLGRSFYSPARTGLYMSFLAEASGDFEDTVRLTTAAAVAVVRAVKELFEIDVDIKWVNDIYLHGKKVCGILCESFSGKGGKKFAVIGIGINLSTSEFPEELRDRAASLFPRNAQRCALTARIADKLCALWSYPSDSEIMEDYRAHSMVLGKRIIFTEDGVETSARALSVDDVGRLTVVLDDGSKKILSSGEISLRCDTME